MISTTGTRPTTRSNALLGIKSVNLGNAEGSSAHGDSGGPIFLPDGEIVGLTDLGLSPPATSLDPADPSFAGFGTLSLDNSVSYYAPWINSVMGATSVPRGEFLVNQTVAGNRMWPSVATDAQGDFVITWTSYGQDGGGSGYGASYNGENGVYARRFNNDTTPASNEFQVNTYTANNQQHSSVAMDSAGDFTISWESYQEAQQNTAGTNSSVPVNYGIYAQQYAARVRVGERHVPGAKRPDERRNPRQRRDGRQSTLSKRRHRRHGRRPHRLVRPVLVAESRRGVHAAVRPAERHGGPGRRPGSQRVAGLDDAGRRDVDVGCGR